MSWGGNQGGWGKQQQGWSKEQGQQGWGQQPAQQAAQQGWGQQPAQQGWKQQGQAQWGHHPFDGGFNPQPNQVYKIELSHHPNMVCDSSCSSHNLSKLVLWKYHEGNNQKWRFLSDGEGNFSIINVGNGGTLEIPPNGQQGTQLFVSQPQNTINQKWRVQQVKDGFAIRSAQNDLAFNVLGDKCKEGDQIGIWPFADAKNDVWKIVPC